MCVIGKIIIFFLLFTF